MATQLTAAQLQTLKADLAANTNTVLINGVATPIDAVPHGAQNAQTIADWYNQTASPSYFVIRTDAPVTSIYNAILWPNYTPAVTITSQNANQFTACSMACQGKQFNLQLMTQGRDSFDATKATQTAGLKDATTQVPSGANFAMQNAGWQQIIPLLSRLATFAEKLLVSGSTAQTSVTPLWDGSTTTAGASGDPAVMGFEGDLIADDILAAWGP